MKRFCCIQLHIISLRSINTDSASGLLCHQLPVHSQIHDVLFYRFQADTEKVNGPFFQKFFRQKDMSLAHSLLQDIKKTAADPVVRVCMDAYL